MYYRASHLYWLAHWMTPPPFWTISAVGHSNLLRWAIQNLRCFPSATTDVTNRHRARCGRTEVFAGKQTLWKAKRRGCLAQGGRFQSSCAILERNLKDYVGLWKLERHGRSWSDARRSRPNNSLRISRQRLAER